jgi:hypothetical protein
MTLITLVNFYRPFVLLHSLISCADYGSVHLQFVQFYLASCFFLNTQEIHAVLSSFLFFLEHAGELRIIIHYIKKKRGGGGGKEPSTTPNTLTRYT